MMMMNDGETKRGDDDNRVCLVRVVNLLDKEL